MMNVKNVLTVGLASFLSGAVASLATVTTANLLDLATAKPFLIGAVMAGLASVFHLYQPKPVSQ